MVSNQRGLKKPKKVNFTTNIQETNKIIKPIGEIFTALIIILTTISVLTSSALLYFFFKNYQIPFIPTSGFLSIQPQLIFVFAIFVLFIAITFAFAPVIAPYYATRELRKAFPNLLGILPPPLESNVQANRYGKHRKYKILYRPRSFSIFSFILEYLAFYSNIIIFDVVITLIININIPIKAIVLL